MPPFPAHFPVLRSPQARLGLSLFFPSNSPDTRSHLLSQLSFWVHPRRNSVGLHGASPSPAAKPTTCAANRQPVVGFRSSLRADTRDTKVAASPERRTDAVNRLFEGGPFWNKQPLSWKELGKNPSFFQSRVAVHGVVSQSYPALHPPLLQGASTCHPQANTCICAPPRRQSPSPLLLSASTTAASRTDTALQQQPHWPLVPRISRCGRPLNYFNSLFLHGRQEDLTRLVSASALPSLSRFRRKTLHRGFLHELLIR